MYHRFNAMGGPCEICLYLNTNQNHFFSVLEKEVRRLEKKYSRYLSNNIIQKINNSYHKKIKLDAETIGLLNYADHCYQLSEGLFDITSGILRKVWDFKDEKIPSQEALNRVLENVGWNKVNWDGEYIQLKKGMEVDFGGIGKEYAVDALARLCEQQHVHHGLINLSGDIRVLGPHPNGQLWEIGIQHPRLKNTAIANIEISQGALASSGDYERFFIHDSKRYCHILNPLTGWPIKNIAAVSIQADECLVAGSVSTIAMLKGAECAVQWLSEIGCDYLVIDENIDIFVL